MVECKSSLVVLKQSLHIHVPTTFTIDLNAVFLIDSVLRFFYYIRIVLKLGVSNIQVYENFCRNEKQRNIRRRIVHAVVAAS